MWHNTISVYNNNYIHIYYNEYACITFPPTLSKMQEKYWFNPKKVAFFSFFSIKALLENKIHSVYKWPILWLDIVWCISQMNLIDFSSPEPVLRVINLDITCFWIISVFSTIQRLEYISAEKLVLIFKTLFFNIPNQFLTLQNYDKS